MRRRSFAKAAQAALLAALAAAALAAMAETSVRPAAARAAAAGSPVELPSGVRYVDLEPGDGATAGRGRQLTLHYRLTLVDGSVVADTRRSRGPLTLRLGGGQVVRGLEEGLLGMRAGGRRRMEVPAALGYGSRALPRIPPDSDLVFVVELLTVE